MHAISKARPLAITAVASFLTACTADNGSDSMTAVPPDRAGVVMDASASDHIEWLAMLLDGKKTGHMKLERRYHDDRVTTTETVHIELNRGPSTVVVRTVDTSIESPSGEPLGFASHQDISNAVTTVSGTVTNGALNATVNSAGAIQEKALTWPTGALMTEGLRQRALAMGLSKGRSFSVKSFLPSSLQAAETTVQIIDREQVDLFGIESALWRVEQRMDLGAGNQTTATAWVTDDYNIKKMQFSILGMTLETIACPEVCALGESEPTTFFVNAFAQSPRPLSNEEQAGMLRYEIVGKEPGTPLRLPESDEQLISLEGDVVTITIGPGVNRAFPSPDRQSHLRPTRWLQSESPEIMALANQGRGSAETPLQVMQHLQTFVGQYVDDKNLGVGYASALEVARDKSGDCTEHAILLAALGRAVGIPTRIATGVAYVDSWLGAEQTFVPHAWTQALIDGDWVSFDAALGRFDAGHIALAYGDGDPLGFYSSVNALGNLVIQSISVQ